MFLVKFTEISKNKAVFWFSLSLDPAFVAKLSTSFGKKVLTAPQMKSESKHDSKQAVLGNVFQKCKSDRPKFTSLPTKNTPKSSKQTDLFESVRAFLL